MRIQEIQPALFKHFQKLVQAERLAHAYLFVGGFGNFEMAIWLAQAIFCSETVKPCGHCRTCRLVEKNEFSDLHIVAPDGQTIKVGQIRELLLTFATTGFESNKKVIIIRESEKMGQNAANALLKSIEEPGSEVFIFLLTENENLILPTIQSRTQKVSFPKNKQYLIDFLVKKEVPKTEADLLSDIVESTDQALALAESDWYFPADKAVRKFVKQAVLSREEAFLALPWLLTLFDGKDEQEIAFELLLVLFNQEREISFIKKTFEAQKMWRANVRFQSTLESILL